MWVKCKHEEGGRNPKHVGFYIVYGITKTGTQDAKEEQFGSYWNGVRWTAGPEKFMPDSVDVPEFWFDTDLIAPPTGRPKKVVNKRKNETTILVLDQKQIDAIRDNIELYPKGLDFHFRAHRSNYKDLIKDIEILGYACEEVSFDGVVLRLSIAKNAELLKIRQMERED